MLSELICSLYSMEIPVGSKIPVSAAALVHVCFAFKHMIKQDTSGSLKPCPRNPSYNIKLCYHKPCLKVSAIQLLRKNICVQMDPLLLCLTSADYLSCASASAVVSPC